MIAAGEPLTDLVPRQDRLIVTARVKPDDIDLVRPGGEARVRLPAYKQRRVPPAEGLLGLVDEAEQAYCTARIRLDEEALGRVSEAGIIPGMPV